MILRHCHNALLQSNFQTCKITSFPTLYKTFHLKHSLYILITYPSQTPTRDGLHEQNPSGSDDLGQ